MSNDAHKTLISEKEEGGYSYADEHSIVYKWEINKITQFLMSAKNSEDMVSLDSPKLSTGAKIEDSWFLQLRLNESSENKSWVSVYLNANNGDRKVRTKYHLFILNNKKEKILHGCRVYDSSLGIWTYHLFDSSISSSWGYPEFVKIDDLLLEKKEFLQNDTLTVGVVLSVYDDYVKINNQISSLKGCKKTLGDDFKDLLIAKKKSDVIIQVLNQKFNAHRLILSTRSCVFEAMFSHDMKENKENEINIPDIDPEVFKNLLHYIYTDKVDDLDRFAEELLEASDKYQLQGLMEMCEVALLKTFNVKNAISILILADRHNAKRLKKVAIDYVATNLVKFKNTEELKALEQDQPSLFVAVLKKHSIEN